VSCHLHLILQFDLTLRAYLYAFLIAAVKSDLPSPGKLNVQFPLPGNVGFAPSQSQPMSAFTKSEAVDSHLKQSSTEVNRFFYAGFFSKILPVVRRLKIFRRKPQDILVLKFLKDVKTFCENVRKLF